MSRSSSSSSSEADEDLILSEQSDIKIESDETEFSLRPYLFEPMRKLSSSEDSERGDDESMEDSDSSIDDEGRLNDLEL